MKKRLYLCGPITGVPGHNKTAFDNAASALRSAGFDVFNPLENGLPRDAEWEMHMRADIAEYDAV
jgi:nucleoside 2-deoxyribosyltransferase